MKKTKASIICDTVCGILELLSVLTFILIGVFTDIWHPTWIIVVISSVVCGVVSIVVGACNKISKQNSGDNSREEI